MKISGLQAGEDVNVKVWGQVNALAFWQIQKKQILVNIYLILVEQRLKLIAIFKLKALIINKNIAVGLTVNAYGQVKALAPWLN